jgi:hypothetical protein
MTRRQWATSAVALVGGPLTLYYGFGRGHSATHVASENLQVRDFPSHLVVSRRKITERSADRLLECHRRLDNVTAVGLSDIAHVINRLVVSKSSIKDSKPRSDELVKILLDASKLREWLGLDVLIATRHGATYLHRDVILKGGEAHRSQILDSLARVATSSLRPLTLSQDEHTIRSLICDTAIDLSTVDELEWVVTSLVQYLRSDSQWQTKFGEKYNLNKLCGGLLTKPMDRLACFGTHRAFALGVVLAANALEPFLDQETEATAIRHLSDFASDLEIRRRDSGGFALPSEAAPAPKGKHDLEFFYAAHALEALAIAPEHIVLSPSILERAVDYLMNRLLEFTPTQLSGHLCPASHAVSAIELLTAVG